MALNFPNAPVRGQLYEAEKQAWYWDNEAWVTPYVGPLLRLLDVTFYGSTNGGSIVYPNNTQAGDLLIHSCFARDNVVPLPEEIGTNFTKIAFQNIPDGSLTTSGLLAFELMTQARTGSLGGFTPNNNGYSSAIFHFRPSVPITGVTTRNSVTDYSQPNNNSDPLGPLVIDAVPSVADLSIAVGNIGCFSGIVKNYTLSEPATEEYSQSNTNAAWLIIGPSADVTFTDNDSSTNKKVMCGGVLDLTFGT